MTIQTPQETLRRVFTSSIIYSLEILKEQEHEDLLVMVNEFLEQVTEINDVKNDKEVLTALLKKYQG